VVPRRWFSSSGATWLIDWPLPELLPTVSVIACVFCPGLVIVGRRAVIGLGAYIGKLAAAGFLLAVFETSIAKMRVFRVPVFLGAALMLALLGTLLMFVTQVR
jgi:formate hydrogenlyase subunit 4